MNTTVQIRIDAKMKKEASKVLHSMGLDMSSGVKLFLAQVVNTKKIPFQVMSADFWPEKKKMALLKEIEKTRKAIQNGTAKTYRTAEELHADILKSR